MAAMFRSLIVLLLCLNLVLSQDTSKLRPLFDFDEDDDWSLDLDINEVLDTFHTSLPQSLAYSSDEGQCVDAWLKLKSTELVKISGGTNVTTKAAYAAIDAFGKPGAGILYGNLQYPGAFDECLDITVDIPMQHCMMTVALVNNNTGKPVIAFATGLCLPQDCTPGDVFKVVNNLGERLPEPYNLFANYTYHGIPIYYCTPQGQKPLSAGAIFMIVVCVIFILLVFGGTLYHLGYEHYEKYQEDKKELAPVNTPDNPKETDGLINSTKVKHKNNIGERLKTFLHESCIGFSLYKTMPVLLSTYQPPAAITSLNGMRVISMFWVILGHTYFFLFAFNMFKNIVLAHLHFGPRFTAQPILNGFFSVDSFFYISGFLVAYLTSREMSRRKGNFPFISYYLHRILRLTPTYMFVLFFFWFLTTHFINGPNAPIVAGPGTAAYNSCVSYWWTNLLYINNFHPVEFNAECMGWTWYLANDMQFFVITPLYLILLHTWFPAGVLALGITLLSSFGVTGFIAAYYDYPANVFYNLYAGITPDPNQPTVDTEIYGKPYCRIGPYLVGILMGYVIFKKYRINFGPLLNWIIHILLWIIAFILGMATVYGFYSSYHGHTLSKAENVIYFMFARTTWGVALAIVTYVCHYGYGGFINRFLSQPFWVPLSRLTFNAYLVHEIILEVLFTNLRGPMPYVDTTMAVYCISAVVLAYGAAAIVTIFVEFPLSNVEMAAFKLFGAKARETSRRVDTNKNMPNGVVATETK